ncbi:hypothetical protein LEL_07739 [Akanthomyces lecanii RCEF 1005]|uniref:Uncharacterized protein n=1 Tax=Akanthomyces lecanii RCEF 1005 TaxID=1081108 RepID=A0A168FXQ7_CORDF|nr:hypothetical protein LEL_07739 [Akanthomyces lecanii RCEF 1005]
MAQTDKMQPPADRPYKKHLDEAASHQTDDYREPGVIQKAVEIGHQAASTKTEEAEEAPAPDPSQQPARPVHDEHIENFVREQHRQDGSKILEGHKQ